MRLTRLGWLPVIVASGILLAGCTAPAPAPSPSVAAVPAEETCAQVMDIGTLVFNLSAAHREGRLQDAEWQGVGRLAESMAAKIDVEPGTDLADAVDALRSTVPRDSNFDDAWNPAFNAFNEACPDAGVENFGIMGWVGG